MRFDLKLKISTQNIHRYYKYLQLFKKKTNRINTTLQTNIVIFLK